MTKITWSDKQELYPPWDEDYQYTSANVNETKASINDLYDIVGAGATTDNQIVVSINTGGSTNKIKNTVEAITDSAVDNTYLVSVRPGIYIEDNFTIPEYVALISSGTDRVTMIEANTTTGTLITLSSSVSVHGFTITGKTSGKAILINSAGGFKVHDMTFSDCDTCIEVDNVGAGGVLSVIDLQDNITTGINILNGSVDSDNIDIDSGFNVGTIIDIDGSNSYLYLKDLHSLSANVGTVINVSGGAEVHGSLVEAEGFTDGIVISESDANVRINNMNLLNAQNDGVRVEASGTDAFVYLFNTTITGSANYNANFLSSTAIVSGSGFSEVDKINIVPGTQLYASILDPIAGHPAMNILGDLHVGSAKRPTESSLGSGDSHVRYLAYTTTDDVAFTDISTEARSFSGSTFTFPSTSAGASIYIGNIYSDSLDNQQPFFGLSTVVNTAAVLGAGNFTIQYYNSNSGWLDICYMETQYGQRYYHYADNIFTHTGNHNIRTDINLFIENDVNLKWDVTDPVSYGTDLYWLRLRIENAITTAPVFEHFGLHTNRSLINSDGWLEFFGNARPKANLPIKLGSYRELRGSMGNNNIWIDADLGVGLQDNKFNTTNQYFGFNEVLPDDLDTSSSVQVRLVCRGDGAGTVTLQATYGKITEGDSAYTSNPTLGPIPSRQTLSKSATFTGADEIQTYTFNLNLSAYRARKDPADGETFPDVLFLTLNPTSIPVNIQMMSIDVVYFGWSEGGHI
jgi:hypothetical protein